MTEHDRFVKKISDLSSDGKYLLEMMEYFGETGLSRLTTEEIKEFYHILIKRGVI